jgi:predicted nucleic acid-binding protein
MRLFVDTSAWIALYYRGDTAHARARASWESLQRQPARLLTSDYVFDETITLMRVRGGHTAAMRLGELLLRSEILEMTEVTAQIRAQAWNVFVQHDGQDFSFTDCTSFAIMRELGLMDAFAFDDHFTQMGFRIWSHPRPSPG